MCFEKQNLVTDIYYALPLALLMKRKDWGHGIYSNRFTPYSLLTYSRMPGDIEVECELKVSKTRGAASNLLVDLTTCHLICLCF